MPHLGIYASKAFQGKSRRGLFGDVMTEVDDFVGQVIAALKEAEIEKNTLIIFASDNGPWIKFANTAYSKKYGEARLNIGYVLPFRDGKGSTWEGGYRVPGIFYWPGIIAPRRQLEPASTLDVLPTVFALTGVELPKGRTLDGRDIRSLFMPEKVPRKLGEFDFLENCSDNLPSAIRKGPWKLMIRQGSQTGQTYGFHATENTPLLFSVEQDLQERIDRAAEQPALVAELLGELRTRREQILKEGTFSRMPATLHPENSAKEKEKNAKR
jgi:arylsulfatase A